MHWIKSVWHLISILVWLVVVSPWATANPQELDGTLTGRWMLDDSSEWGTLELTFGRDSSVRGLVTNGPMIGPWVGQMDRNGLLTAQYQLANVTFDARSQLQFRRDGSLVGPVTFFQAGRVLGQGQIQLERYQP